MANPFAALGNILQGKAADGHTNSDIFEAIENDDSAAVEQFLSRGARINQLSQDGWTPVQLACWSDKMKALGSLLKWNPDLSVRDSVGRTAVHLAAFNGSERCLRRVLHAGAEVDTRDRYGLTPLHKASVAGQLASMRTLLEYKADVSLPTADGLTAAHLAAWKGHREALRLLHSARADIEAPSNDGSTPLHEAVRSGDQDCVELLLQLGSNPAAADRFGRTPSDLAFASGNRAMFAVLHEATQKAAAAAAAPEDTSEIPEPSEFWEYLQKQDATPAAKAGAAQAPAPSSQPAPPEETHPRKQFESWLGGILFPQRQRTSAPVASSGTPYGTVNKSSQPPPSLAKPAFNQMMKQQGGQHKVGHAGGSQFAARKAEKQHAPAAAAARAEADAPVENIQLTLDPYDGSQRTSKAEVNNYSDVQPPPNPLAAMMAAIGKKAGDDIKTTMGGVASMMSSLPPPTPEERLREQQAKRAQKPTMGDDDAYDSDEYDESVLEKAQEGAHADAENWGEFEDQGDAWGTSGSDAFQAQKRAQRAAASEGRIYTMQEAREKLDMLDAATSAAQGWLRGLTPRQRLTAMTTFAANYPKVPQPGAKPSAPPSEASSEDYRVKAASPLAILTQGLWQSRPHEQEEERVAVQAHLQKTTAAARVMAQSAGDTPSPVPLINFKDAWLATDGFASSGLLLEDAFGKVYRADILGGTHALRVLNSSLYDPSSLSQYLDAAAQLDHSHIVRLKGAAPDRGMLVLDLPESGNLLYVLQTAVLPTTERLGWNGCVDIALSVASALQYLHNRPVPMAHGRLNAAAVYFDRNATAKVGDVGLAAVCSQEGIAADKLMSRDLISLGEIMMQLLTLNTQPIDDDMRKSILAFVDSGQHIKPSSALSWPKSTAEKFEMVAVACMRAGESEDTAKALNEGVIPMLQGMRGETLQSIWKSGGEAKKRADGSYIAPSAYRCPLTGEVMLDPVRAADGFVYERSAIEQWLALGRKNSPMTNTPLSHPYVIPDRDLREAVQTWLQSQNGARAPVAA